jgi:PadR family transcriptional regulator PadR
MPPWPRPDRRLLSAWLLLLLEREPGYGYELCRRFEANELSPQPSALYRELHRLEQDGAVASAWAPIANGPPRRLYRLTAQGGRQLAEIADAIDVTRRQHARFLSARAEAANVRQLG